jgi:hypothetical protein
MVLTMRIHVFEMGAQKRHPYKKLEEAIFARYWFPVANAKWTFRDRSVGIRFYATLADDIFDCDVLILSSRSVQDYLFGTSRFGRTRAEFCDRISKRVPKVVWFDSRDSAGNSQFDVLPYVNSYLKRSIYKDRSMYMNTYHAGRVFSDYYAKTFGVEDDPEKLDLGEYGYSATRDPDQLKKIRLGWGCGAEFHWPTKNWSTMTGYLIGGLTSQCIRAPSPQPVLTSPSAARSIDISALFDETRYHLRTVGYQRKLANEATARLSCPNKRLGRVPRNEFYDILRNSKVTVSVFGWGEVCYREYEAGYCGSAILMADMSHVLTYPEFYLANQYYTPFSWDFSDFEEKAVGLLADEDKRIGMAENAQKFLAEQWTERGKERFVDHFLGAIM